MLEPVRLFKGFIRFKSSCYDCSSFEFIEDHDDLRRRKLSYAEHNIFTYLAKNSNELVDKRDLEKVGWPDRHVSSSYLTVLIASLRKKISFEKSIVIENVPGRGYSLKIVGEGSILWDEKVVDIVDHVSKEADESLVQTNTSFEKDERTSSQLEKVSTSNKIPKYNGRIFAILLTYFFCMFLVFLIILIDETSVEFECSDNGDNIVCIYGESNMSENNIVMFNVENKHIKVIHGK